jgi:hypothetical protein
MTEAPRAPQDPPVEPKDQNVAVRCTATEKRAVQFLALALDSTESDIMRGWLMEDVVAEADRRRTLMNRVAV